MFKIILILFYLFLIGFGFIAHAIAPMSMLSPPKKLSSAIDVSALDPRFRILYDGIELGDNDLFLSQLSLTPYQTADPLNTLFYIL